MFNRSIDFSGLAETFFLWGPRQVGKSSVLEERFPTARRVDLLLSDLYVRYQTRPYLLREELASHPPGEWVVIDEIQKVPALLDEIHWMIEHRRMRFALCGSSARKVKRGHANLLGGRASRRELLGLTAAEIGRDFDLVRLLNHGTLPAIYLAQTPKDKLRSYCADYLKEEIAAEGLVRNLPGFARFLESAALCDTEQVAFATMARDMGVSPPTARSYFEILEDTLLGRFLPAYRRRPKRRLEAAPKFYFFDVGVVGHLAKRGHVVVGSELFGKAFESWVHHELRAYQAYREPDMDLSFWRASSQVEVDFIVGNMDLAIEAKGSERVRLDHLKGLRELKKDYRSIGQRVVVSLEARERTTDDGIRILPYSKFVAELWAGELVRTA